MVLCDVTFYQLLMMRMFACVEICLPISSFFFYPVDDDIKCISICETIIGAVY